MRDVVVARSSDQGATWTPPVRVHADEWKFDACPHAGPAIALKASCDLEGIEGGVSSSISCDQIEGDGLKFKSVDYGVIVGAGLAFDVYGRTFNVGARYDHSLAEIDDQSGIKHRVISLMATFEFPWMK
jgi:hypothetical protein